MHIIILGNIFQELGDDQKAKDCYQKAIEIDPNYVNALNNLGVIFLGIRRTSKSKRMLRKSN